MRGWTRRALVLAGGAVVAAFTACGGDDDGSGANAGTSSGGPIGDGATGAPIGDTGAATPPVASCAAAGGSADVAVPTLLRKLADERSAEGWLGSPAVADLDGDGKPETIVARGGRVVVWRADGSRAFTVGSDKDRIWASPVVANFTGDTALEIGFAARDQAYLFDAKGVAVTGFPQKFGTSETRTVAAGDLDGDGALDLVVGVRNDKDIVHAYHANGSAVPGFPPVASGASGCEPGPCYFAGLYDQNLAIGSFDGDAKQGLVLPHDNAYASIFRGTGAAYDSNAMYRKRPKTPGVRYLHDLPLAQQGFADDEAVSNQAHFTNTPPAIADVDGDGTPEIVMVGSVQNASQEDRLRGVALWVIKSDASRLAGWESPFHVPAYVMGLNDGFSPSLGESAVAGAGNLVGLTNQVTVADIDAGKRGREMIFAGYDGKIHAVAADKTELWSFAYAENGRALTPGIVVADLSADGVPEVVFATYTPDKGTGALFVLSAAGKELHRIPLPERGSMAVPTIADTDSDGSVEIVVSLKDEVAANESVHVYGVASAKPNCLLWPTGRANDLRNGWVR